MSAPHKVTLLRGNHELRKVNGMEAWYGAGSFLTQCKQRFGVDTGVTVWEEVNKAFDCLPLAAVVDDHIFCAHGGVPRPVPVPPGRCVVNPTPPTPLASRLENGAAMSRSPRTPRMKLVAPGAAVMHGAPSPSFLPPFPPLISAFVDQKS